MYMFFRETFKLDVLATSETFGRNRFFCVTICSSEAESDIVKKKLPTLLGTLVSYGTFFLSYKLGKDFYRVDL